MKDDNRHSADDIFNLEPEKPQHNRRREYTSPPRPARPASPPPPEWFQKFSRDFGFFFAAIFGIVLTLIVLAIGVKVAMGIIGW